jgi:hypothetical protein
MKMRQGPPKRPNTRRVGKRAFEYLRIIIQEYSKEKDHGDMDRISYQRY